MKDAIKIRAAQSEDIPFIFSTWLKSYKHSSYFAKRIRYDIFFDNHHSIIERIIAKPTCRALVACLDDDPSVILGYIVFETTKVPTFHYIFIKKAFREMQISKMFLLDEKIDPDSCQFTHWTFDLDKVLKKYPNMIYNPYAL